MNLRPSGYEPDELPGCSIPRHVCVAYRPEGCLRPRFASFRENVMFFARSGGDLLSHVLRRSTISATALNGRVRNGIGCFARAMATRPRKEHLLSGLSRGALFEASKGISRPLPYSAGAVFQVVVQFPVSCMAFGSSLAVSGSDQAYRTISIGQLNALLRLHLRPIDVVVYHGPRGYLVLRGASRLDAFSGYPVRS